MKNKVIVLGHYGSDESHALSAWTSTSRDLTKEKRGRIDKLLSMLAKNGHHTPFEKSCMHFLVTQDIASHIHTIKHRIGVSVNGESARYKELKENKYYIPHDWPIELQERLKEHTLKSFELYHRNIKELVDLGFSRKRAKESSRFYLQYNNQLDCDVSFNFRSFMHFLGLRKAEGAQLEIREIAEKMLCLVREMNHVEIVDGQKREVKSFEKSLAAFGY